MPLQRGGTEDASWSGPVEVSYGEDWSADRISDYLERRGMGLFLLVVFGFGLFHGFGFAGALSEMGVLGEHLGLSLFAFNLGVEIGQVVIVTALFPLLFLVRRLKLYRKVVLPAAAVFMILGVLTFVTIANGIGVARDMVEHDMVGAIRTAIADNAG